MGACVRVLDLGSGKGATARHLAGHFGCHVTCFNLGENQNAHCVAEARAAGVGHLVECVRGNFNAGLPADWTASFDIVWSQEALCHAQDQRAVLREVMRVLKPGGAAIFTDIMRNQVRALCSCACWRPERALLRDPRFPVAVRVASSVVVVPRWHRARGTHKHNARAVLCRARPA